MEFGDSGNLADLLGSELDDLRAKTVAEEAKFSQALAQTMGARRALHSIETDIRQCIVGIQHRQLHLADWNSFISGSVHLLSADFMQRQTLRIRHDARTASGLSASGGGRSTQSAMMASTCEEEQSLMEPESFPVSSSLQPLHDRVRATAIALNESMF